MLLVLHDEIKFGSGAIGCDGATSILRIALLGDVLKVDSIVVYRPCIKCSGYGVSQIITCDKGEGATKA